MNVFLTIQRFFILTKNALDEILNVININCVKQFSASISEFDIRLYYYYY